jgi:hypothetical protein
MTHHDDVLARRVGVGGGASSSSSSSGAARRGPPQEVCDLGRFERALGMALALAPTTMLEVSARRSIASRQRLCRSKLRRSCWAREEGAAGQAPRLIASQACGFNSTIAAARPLAALPVPTLSLFLSLSPLLLSALLL